MTFTDWAKRRPLLGRLLLIVFLLLLGLALANCSQHGQPPNVHPAPDAPVTAAVDGRRLVIMNNSAQPIYHRVFPTDILPVIEWAPCLAPETCPDEERIEPGQERQIAYKSVARDQTESITVFWWVYLDRVPGASIPPMEMHEFVIPLP